MALAQALVASYGDVSLWSDPSVFMDFQNTATSYIRAGTGQSDTKTTSLFSSVSGWTFARSSVAYHLNSSGNFVEASSGSPRIDHDASGTAKGLLVEPASANEMFSSTPYVNTSTNAEPWTVTTNVNTTSNTLPTQTLLNSTFYQVQRSDTATMQLAQNSVGIKQNVAGTHTYTCSAYVKALNTQAFNLTLRIDGGGADRAQQNFTFNSDGSVTLTGAGATGGSDFAFIDSGSIDIGDGIYRIFLTLSFTYDGDPPNQIGRIRFRSTGGGSSGSNGDGFLISHVQMEESDALTSYIRKAHSTHVWNGSALGGTGDSNYGTNTGNARAAETARLDLGSNGWYSGGGPTTIMATVRNDDLTPSVNQAMVSLQDASDNDVRFAMFAKVGSGDKITAQFVNGSVSGSFENSSAMTEGQNVTAAASFAQDGTAVDVLHTQDGTTATASTKASATISTANLDALIFGAIGTAGDQTLNGTIRSAYVWPRALSAKQIEAFTSSTPPTDPSPGT